MKVYEQVDEMFRYHFEAIDSKCIKVLKEESSDYRKTHDELITLLNLTWFTKFLNGSLTVLITLELRNGFGLLFNKLIFFNL